MPDRKAISKLRAQQQDARNELILRIKAAQERLAAKIAKVAADPRSSASQKFREAFFGQIRSHYEGLAVELDGWGKALVEKTAVDWHKAAVVDIKAAGGRVAAKVLKFNPARVQRYWGMVNPDNEAHLVGVFTQRMAATDIQALRTAFVDMYRQRALEDWSQGEFQKRLQERWDELAGNLFGNRFVDAAGRPWRNAAYLSMLARTTTARIARDSYFDTLIENGDDLARIGPSGDSCPICLAWAGVIISISGADKRFPSYQDALNAGMFHPQCDCLCTRMDETVHAEDIARQAGAPTPSLERAAGETDAAYRGRVNDALQGYKGEFEKTPAKEATATLEDVKRTWASNEFRQSLERLSPAEKASLKIYQGDESINTSMRESKTLTDAERTLAKNLDSAIKSHELSTPVMAYRGTQAEVWEQAIPGQEVVDLGYCSTSLSRNVAAEYATKAAGSSVLLEMELTAGQTAMYIAGEEDELLLPRGGIYRIVRELDGRQVRGRLVRRMLVEVVSP